MTARAWLGLAALVALASVDEALTLHETLGLFIERWYAPGGLLYFVWVLPRTFVLLAVVLVYGRFVANLPPELRRTLVIGAGVWAASASGWRSASLLS